MKVRSALCVTIRVKRFYIDSETALSLGISGTDWAFLVTVISMWMIFSCGWKITAKISPTRCGITPLGRLFFLLLFGVYGSIGIMLSFETALPIWTFTKILCLELQNFSIVLLIRYTWAKKPCCKSDGTNPNQVGLVST